MTQLLNLISPFKTMSGKQKLLGTLSVLALVFITWFASGSSYIPTPVQIAGAFGRLFTEDRYDIVSNFIASLGLVSYAMAYAML